MWGLIGLIIGFFSGLSLCLVGGFKPSEKYESQLELLFPIYGKIKHVPNHQPDVKGDHWDVLEPLKIPWLVMKIGSYTTRVFGDCNLTHCKPISQLA